MSRSIQLSSSGTTRTLLVTGASSEMGSALIRKLLSNNSCLGIRAMVYHSLVNIPGCEIRQGDLKNSNLLAKKSVFFYKSSQKHFVYIVEIRDIESLVKKDQKVTKISVKHQ